MCPACSPLATTALVVAGRATPAAREGLMGAVLAAVAMVAVAMVAVVMAVVTRAAVQVAEEVGVVETVATGEPPVAADAPADWVHTAAMSGWVTVEAGREVGMVGATQVEGLRAAKMGGRAVARRATSAKVEGTRVGAMVAGMEATMAALTAGEAGPEAVKAAWTAAAGARAGRCTPNRQGSWRSTRWEVGTQSGCPSEPRGTPPRCGSRECRSAVRAPWARYHSAGCAPSRRNS